MLPPVLPLHGANISFFNIKLFRMVLCLKKLLLQDDSQIKIPGNPTGIEE